MNLDPPPASRLHLYTLHNPHNLTYNLNVNDRLDNVVPITVDNFSQQLAAGEASLSVYSVVGIDAATTLDILVRKCPRATDQPANLLIIFHGAIDQRLRRLPHFEGDFLDGVDLGNTWVISIADPTLARSKQLRACWYCGSEDHDVPKSIRDLLDAVVGHLQPQRIVFFGGSSGGHPALFHSRQFPGSICVVKNPITNIEAYGASVAMYRRHCWPSHPNRPLGELIASDVAPFYAAGFENEVIYLQNATDRLLWQLAVPFLHSLIDSSHLHFCCRHWSGYNGHTLPAAEVASWISAALAAPTCSLEDVRKTYSSRSSLSSPKSHISRASANQPPANPPKETRATGTRCHPYVGLPRRHFWKDAISNRHQSDWADLWTPPPMSASDNFATGGSCFAQHIGRHLQMRGANFMDLEKAPASLPPEDRPEHGYNIYTCRYGNIYSTRQLLQLAQEALGLRTVEDLCWEKNGRFHDSRRPGITPDGLARVEDVAASRNEHLSKVSAMLKQMRWFVFTLGLTEAWLSRVDGTVYQTAPGVAAGRYDPEKHEFVNFKHAEIIGDLSEFWALVKKLNPEARMILTVSPVPLAATASSDHVLVATTRSKSVLRSVASEAADSLPDIFYFPSYEIVASHPGRATFFNPDLRTVSDTGVRFVMSHFFQSWTDEGDNGTGTNPAEIVCDEEQIG